MAVKLEKSIKRELDMEGRAYTITIAPEGIKVVEKGKRKSGDKIDQCENYVRSIDA